MRIRMTPPVHCAVTMSFSTFVARALRSHSVPPPFNYLADTHRVRACRYIIIAHVLFHNRSGRSEITTSRAMEILKSCIFAIRLRAGQFPMIYAGN
jgi:hypothetical protein